MDTLGVDTQKASKVFDESMKVVVTCNVMILWFGQNREVAKTSVLFTCTSLANLDHGRVFMPLVRSHFDLDVYVVLVLIAMYIKCDNLVKAKHVFDRYPLKDVVMGSSIIIGYAQHELGEESLQVFLEICSLGIKPDEITIFGVLSICNYTGKINKVMNLIEKIPVEGDAIVWGALLGACKTYMKLNLVEVAAKKLLELKPNNVEPYILLSNIYPSKGRWFDVAKLRENMRARSVTKLLCCSWIEVPERMPIRVMKNLCVCEDCHTLINLIAKVIRRNNFEGC
ncbi:hypothetical protein FNV43_RR04347 [Rhamnella rubrinervis]|uniref:Pentatricopeptide repeat-containing protein n=1 Tax=Rhamnella rubrinervis TaxID=2594499 RepID=A0A8K0MPH2_9ROSA|nr:hypothetical protein FNV43_RR04347 [Rhamnella rubrinervis]